MAWISKDTKDYLKEISRDLWYYSSLSFSIAFSIIIGLAIGIWLDAKFGITPILTLAGLWIGICAGFKNILNAMKKVQRIK